LGHSWFILGSISVDNEAIFGHVNQKSGQMNRCLWFMNHGHEPQKRHSVRGFGRADSFWRALSSEGFWCFIVRIVLQKKVSSRTMDANEKPDFLKAISEE